MLARLKAAYMALAVLHLAALVQPASVRAQPVTARPTQEFLDSVGIVSTLPDRGQSLEGTIGMLRYVGFRWLRGGIEGLTEQGPTTVETYLTIHRATGAKIAWGLVSGGNDLEKLLRTGRILAMNGALLAFEGNNEPNNWGVNYKGEEGGRGGSWLPVAKLQAELYARVKSDPVLAKYPVWSISEPGAQVDNAGLQFLEIPQGSGTLMPPGTRYADFANVHNYIYHPNSPHPANNKTWNASDPSEDSAVDGLYGNFGLTWAKHFKGYTNEQLKTLPRVTTETGVPIGEKITEDMHASHLVNIFLSQFARGYAFTSVYLLRDREDEGGNQQFGFFRADYTPRKAAVYLRNLMGILNDNGRRQTYEKFDYSIEMKPDTVHDLLLQKSDGTFQLVLWAERLGGEENIEVKLGKVASMVKIHDTAIGAKEIRSLKDVDRFGVVLSDRPVVISFR